MATTKLWTIEDVERLPDDGYRYELIEGVLRRMSPAGWEHGTWVSEVNLRVTAFVKLHRLGRVVSGDPGFVLARDPDVLLAPDVAFVRRDRLPPRSQRLTFSAVPPDLVIEVRSPSESNTDVADKVRHYQAAGVPLIWYFWPERRTVTVYPLGQEPRVVGPDGVLDGEEVLPGFQLSLAELIRELDED
jgi:Uma2 family endonuclease